jgi:hypothetical protein
MPYQTDKEPSISGNGNNLYVKFIPDDWNEQTLHQKFGVFGVIKSLKLCRNSFGQYAFICYYDPNATDRNECFKNAATAQKEMN